MLFLISFVLKNQSLNKIENKKEMYCSTDFDLDSSGSGHFYEVLIRSLRYLLILHYVGKFLRRFTPISYLTQNIRCRQY